MAASHFLVATAGALAAGFLTWFAMNDRLATTVAERDQLRRETDSLHAALREATTPDRPPRPESTAGAMERLRRGIPGFQPGAPPPAAPPRPSAFERPPDPRTQRLREQVEARLAVLREQLALTDAQTEAARPLVERMNRPIAALQQMLAGGGGYDEAEMRRREQAARQDRAAAHAAFEAALTPEQRERYTALRTGEREMRLARTVDGDLAELESRCTLTPEQKEKAAAVLRDLAVAALAAEEAGADAPRDTRRDALAAILTKDQLAAWDRGSAPARPPIQLPPPR